MIQKLESGILHIQLGEGTVFVGNVYEKSDEKKLPVGICFTNNPEPGLLEDTPEEVKVVLGIDSVAGLASYILAAYRFVLDLDIDNDLRNQLATGLKDLEFMLQQGIAAEK